MRFISFIIFRVYVAYWGGIIYRLFSVILCHCPNYLSLVPKPSRDMWRHPCTHGPSITITALFCHMVTWEVNITMDLALDRKPGNRSGSISFSRVEWWIHMILECNVWYKRNGHQRSEYMWLQMSVWYVCKVDIVLTYRKIPPLL